MKIVWNGKFFQQKLIKFSERIEDDSSIMNQLQTAADGNEFLSTIKLPE